MTNYLRFYIPGATGFFTVNLAKRRDNHLLVENIGLLRAAFHDVKKSRPFDIDAAVVMPDHLISAAYRVVSFRVSIISPIVITLVLTIGEK